jgi:ribosomal protein S18 acetylase RimI-like enzyme
VPEPAASERGDLPPGPGEPRRPVALVDLDGSARERAVAVIRDGFVGIYRWHAKRTLREVPTVRAAVLGGEVVGVSLLDLLVPEVGYVYYVAVLRAHRGLGVGGSLLDDALGGFRTREVFVVYAAVQANNVPSRRLFERRGFRPVERREPGWLEGGLGAWGLRSRMRLVPGEVLLGLRLKPPPTTSGTERPEQERLDGGRGTSVLSAASASSGPRGMDLG